MARNCCGGAFLRVATEGLADAVQGQSEARNQVAAPAGGRALPALDDQQGLSVLAWALADACLVQTYTPPTPGLDGAYAARQAPEQNGDAGSRWRDVAQHCLATTSHTQAHWLAHSRLPGLAVVESGAYWPAWAASKARSVVNHPQTRRDLPKLVEARSWPGEKPQSTLAAHLPQNQTTARFPPAHSKAGSLWNAAGPRSEPKMGPAARF